MHPPSRPPRAPGRLRPNGPQPPSPWRGSWRGRGPAGARGAVMESEARAKAREASVAAARGGGGGAGLGAVAAGTGGALRCGARRWTSNPERSPRRRRDPGRRSSSLPSSSSPLLHCVALPLALALAGRASAVSAAGHYSDRTRHGTRWANALAHCDSPGHALDARPPDPRRCMLPNQVSAGVAGRRRRRPGGRGRGRGRHNARGRATDHSLPEEVERAPGRAGRAGASQRSTAQPPLALTAITHTRRGEARLSPRLDAITAAGRACHRGCHCVSCRDASLSRTGHALGRPGADCRLPTGRRRGALRCQGWCRLRGLRQGHGLPLPRLGSVRLGFAGFAPLARWQGAEQQGGSARPGDRTGVRWHCKQKKGNKKKVWR